MEIPREELKEVIDRFEKDIEAGISSRNWLPYLAKIRAWLEAVQQPHEAELLSSVCLECGCEAGKHHKECWSA